VFDLWIVRHGQTDWNVEGRLQGWLDVPLNHVGRDQAERLAHAIRNVPLQQIFSSDLIRAQETAQILARGRTCAVRLEPRLRERRFGPLEGLRRTDLPARSTGEQRSLYPPIDESMRDEEPERDFLCRVRAFLEQVANEPWQGRVLAVTHGGFVRAVLTVLGHEPPARVHNTSITQLRWLDGSWSVEVVDWAEHLQNGADHPALESDLAK
jgi:2,3-bisphosphoglycerate-dependent phosphoglycerate mutase